MSTLDIPRLATLLESTKVKDRNDALNQLEFVSSSKYRLSSKQLRILTTSIFHLLDYESRIYKNGSSTSRNSVGERLNSASYCLRLLIERSISDKLNIRYKVYLDVCLLIKSLFYIQGELLAPCSVNFAKIMGNILSVKYVVEHLNKKDWSMLFFFIIDVIDRCLQNMAKRTTTTSNYGNGEPIERIIAEFWIAVESLLQCECSSCSIQIYHNDQYFSLLSVLNETSQIYKKENPLYISLFKIINKLIVSLATVNFKFVNKLVNIGLKLIVCSYETNWEKLQDQHLIFLNLPTMHRFISLHGLPKLFGDNNLQLSNILDEVSGIQNGNGNKDKGKDNSENEEHGEVLLYNIQQLILFSIQNMMSNPRSLASSSIGISPQNAKVTWFKLKNIYFRNQEPPKPWLHILAVVKLLKSYFAIKKKLASLLSGISIYGKGAHMGIIQTSLLKSSSTVEFCSELLSFKTSPDIQTLGLKILTFYIEAFPVVTNAELGISIANENKQSVTSRSDSTNTTFDFTINNDLESKFSIQTLLHNILCTFDVESSRVWALLLSRTLIKEHDAFRETKPLIRLNFLRSVFMLSLNSLNRPNSFTTACDLVFEIIVDNEQDFHKLVDNSVLTQVDSTIDLSEVNGPYLIHNESFKFWYAIYKMSVELNLPKRSVFPRKIEDWLMAKWDMVFYPQNHSFLETSMCMPDFLFWLSGNDLHFVEANSWWMMTDLYAGSFFSPVVCAQEYQESLESFLVLEGENTEKNQKAHNFSGIPQFFGERYWTKLVDTFKTFNVDPVSYAALLSWLVFIMNIYIKMRSVGDTNTIAKLNLLRYQLSIGIGSFRNSHISIDDAYEISRVFNTYLSSSETSCSTIAEFIRGFPFDEITRIMDSEYLRDRLFNRKRSFRKEEGEEEEEEEKEREKDDDYDAVVSNEFATVRESSTSPAEQWKIDITYLELSQQHSQPQIFQLLEFKMFKSTLELKRISDSLSELLTFAEHIGDTHILSVLWFLVDRVLPRITTMQPEETLSVTQLIRLLGNRILADQRFEKNEMVLVMVSKMLKLLVPLLVENNTNTDSALVKDCNDVIAWIYALGSKDFITTTISLRFYVDFLISYLQVANDHVVKRSDLENEIYRQISESTNEMRIHIVDEVSSFIAKSSSLGQEIIYSRLFDTFGDPQSSVETGGTYVLFFAKLASASPKIFSMALFNLLECSTFPFLVPYLKKCLNHIIIKSRFRSRSRSSDVTIRDIFVQFKLELLRSWWINDSFDTFPFTLFEYECLDDFLSENYRDLVACIVSTKPPNEKVQQRAGETLLNLARLKKVTLETIVAESLSLFIPLSYTKYGVKNSAFELLAKYVKDYKSEVQSQLSLLVLEIIKFIDVSKETDVGVMFPNQDTLTSVLVGTSDSKTFDVSTNLSICMKSGVELINKIVDKYSDPGKEFWSMQNTYFLIRQISSLLDPSETEFCYNAVILRRIKLVILLSSGGDPLSVEAMGMLASTLSPFLVGDNSYLLVNDILCIFASFSNLYHHGNQDEISKTLYVITEIAYALFLSSNNNTKESSCADPLYAMVIGKVKDYLDNVETFNREENSYLKIVSAAIKVLSGESVHIQMQMSDMVSCLTESTSKTLLALLSEVFDYIDVDADVSTEEVPENSKVTQFLVGLPSSQIQQLSKGFKLWISNYLSRFYLKSSTIKSLDVVEPLEFPNVTIDDFGENAKYYDQAIQALANRYTASNNHIDCATAESVLGCLIMKHLEDPQDLSRFINFQVIAERFSHYILPMSLSTCVLLNDETKIKYKNITLDQICQNFEAFFKTHSDTWCVTLYLAILQELSKFTSLGPIMSAFVIKVPSFATETLAPLVCFYLSIGGRQGEDKISLIFNCFLNIVKNTPVLASSTFLNVLRYIRIAAKTSRLSAYKRVFDKVSVKEYYQVAIKSKMFKTAMMLFEDACFNDDFTDPLDIHYDELRTIYENLDYEDLIYGLPERTTLEHILSMINTSSAITSTSASTTTSTSTTTTTTQFQYSSGLLDTSLKLDEPPAWTCVESVSKAGMLGMAQLMSKNLDSTAHSGDEYEWSWKLSKWVQPVPKDTSCTNKIIYGVLKQIHDSSSSPSSSIRRHSICQEALLKVLDIDRNGVSNSIKEKKEATRSWLKSLACVQSISDLVNGSDSGIVLREPFSVEFKMLEDVLLARQTVLQVLAEDPESKSVADELWFSSLIEMVKYNNLARQNKENQKMISSMILINGICKKLQSFEISLSQNMMNLSLYQAAQTLWAQGNTNVPVLMLKELYNSGGVDVQDGDLKVDKFLIRAMMVEWMSESRQDLASNLMTTQVLPTAEKAMMLADPKQQVQIFHLFAKFCESQFKSRSLNEKIDLLEKRSQEKKNQVREEKVHVDELPSGEKRLAIKYLTKLKSLYNKERLELAEAKANKKQFFSKAVEYYLQSLSMGSDSARDLDKFVALWLEQFDDNDLHEKIEPKLLALPTYKLLSWCSQLVSRLVTETSRFQLVLRQLILNMCADHPYHSLHLLISLKLQAEQAKKDSNSLLFSKANSAKSILQELSTKDPCYVNGVLLPFVKFTEECVKLTKVKATGHSMNLQKTPLGAYWLHSLPRIPTPTKTLKVDHTLKYDNIPVLQQVRPEVGISDSGLSKPKIASFILSDGSKHRILFKYGADDLRQDSIMEQVFGKVQNIFEKDKECSNRYLTIRTYNVVPLGPKSGIIEFVPNSLSLSDCILQYHNKFDQLKIGEARKLMAGVQSQGKEARVKVYKDIECKVKPVLRYFLQNNFLTPDSWFDSRVKYSRGVATSSIVGYILGLGDRHCNNILLDKSSGEPIHIDLGVAFDQGHSLPVPETVPFRLTRDMVDGLGVTGVEGVFKKSCEHTMRVLRENKEHIISILDVLRWDPLYSWTLSPTRKKSLQKEEAGGVMQPENDGSEAGRAIVTVSEKLAANGLSIEAAVRELIQEATNPENLALIYQGWSPFY
ncbi:TEL1 [Candida oxycetoniae]|uniref:Serine/threonine-protein kinase Tel1 n=1 Tax=Candida oxycetoniae TaxID=497107 RepID=A0AAI9ST48_9ASCO|nr:TEL1 [Candida oxycetoniae]KAI3402488.2 TEL1 [Candida oxycetoniae]